MKYTKTKISTFVILVYSQLVLIKLNWDLLRFNQVSFMKYWFEKILVKSWHMSLINLVSHFNLGFSQFIFLWGYLKRFSFSPYFLYIWDVNKVIHKVSVLMIPADNQFLCVGKKLLTTELHISYPQKHIYFGIWPLWSSERNPYFSTRVLKSELHKNMFFIFRLSFYQFSSFFA